MFSRKNQNRTLELENEVTRLRFRKSVLKQEVKRLKNKLDKYYVMLPASKFDKVENASLENSYQNNNSWKNNHFYAKVFSNLVLSLESKENNASLIDLKIQKISDEVLSKLSELTELIKLNSQEIEIEKIRAISKELKKDLWEKPVTEIENIFSNIQDITDKANLLALSGSIETAKLNEKGQGLKVVVDELKNLSKFVKSMVHKHNFVLSDINDLQSQDKENKNNAIEMLVSLLKINDWNKINLLIRKLISLINKIAELNNLSNYENFIKKFEQDHMEFSLKIYKTLMGISHYTKQEMEEAHECTLGKWFYLGEGKNMLKRFPSLSNMERPHKEFHIAGIKALDYFYKEQFQLALSQLGTMEKFGKNIVAIARNVLEHELKTPFAPYRE